MTPIAEYQGVDEARFRSEIEPLARPAVLRGLVRHWPAVAQACQSPAAFCRYLGTFDNGQPVDAILLPPREKGRIFYNEAMDGFNFARNRVPLSAIVDQLSRYAHFDEPPSVAVQSTPIPDCLPGFVAQNPLPLLDPSVVPRLWMGNRVIVPAHFDESQNVACVVAGRRRFTLFPPEQIGNLYIGPLDHAPTGTPISMVDLAAPDLERHPRFAQALAAAQVAELEPGDALFIPTLWWHHVASLDRRLNVLVNYWWKGSLGAVDSTASVFGSLLHAMLHVRSLPPELRRAWQAVFVHYVFDADPAEHIPAPHRGLLGPLTPERAEQLRQRLIATLQR
ncbi:cupin-like domain-containing protein [Piscinibacter sp. XHJ-5]|uniref:cupin-like domain-containing protein n=1 Tax=Piscinibacter sp. XHJ-5 TaxID=3037797 RepID=UPI0024531B43|nr:cupin-like domain-containing protein [Piscinibacter sp. XHJ-5]